MIVPHENQPPLFDTPSLDLPPGVVKTLSPLRAEELQFVSHDIPTGVALRPPTPELKAFLLEYEDLCRRHGLAFRPVAAGSLAITHVSETAISTALDATVYPGVVGRQTLLDGDGRQNLYPQSKYVIQGTQPKPVKRALLQTRERSS